MTRSASPKKCPRLAYFISSHGFGHAARASAVMKALLKKHPQLRFIIFTQTPQWFFQETLSDRFEYVNVQTDVGMVQQNPTREDFAASISALNAFKNNFHAQARALAGRLAQLNCPAALCDISPLGLAAARLAKIPSILIENFTWDWIYSHYSAEAVSALTPYIQFMRDFFFSADHRIQTQPVCQTVAADLRTSPVSRPPRLSSSAIRSGLGISRDAPMVMITMGGVSTQYRFLDLLEKNPRINFVIPSAAHRELRRRNLILLPEKSDFYHPDLIHASDAVIGKVGYSTLAEVYAAGVPFGYVQRPIFPESASLAAFIQTEMAGVELDESDFYHGGWIKQLPKILSLQRGRLRKENGADQIAEYLSQILT